jgi:hypothetical protein
MSIFNRKLQPVFVQSNEEEIIFMVQMLDGTWIEIHFLNSAEIRTIFHNKRDESGELIPFTPKGEKSSAIFKNDPSKESAFVRFVFTAALMLQKELLSKLEGAANLLEVFGYRLEEPPENDPSGYTDPISPVPAH